MKLLARVTLPLAALLLSSCALFAPSPEKVTLTPVSYADLPGWDADNVVEALPALQRSCAVLSKKSPYNVAALSVRRMDFRAACAALAAVNITDDAVARAFITTWFEPYAVEGSDGQDGLFTGYYEAELRGALQQGGAYQTPLYAKPDDWAEADLGDFKPELRGQKLIGRVAQHKFVPYDDRASIVQNNLAGRARVIAWVDDAVDAFFLAIQGSGRVRLDNGSFVRVGYDGTNGKAYVAIGRAMADQGLLERPVSMVKIRGWLAAHPKEASAVMNQNPSYVFFREIMTDSGPIGAMGIALTPKRSLAVDPAFIPLGVPLFLATTDGIGAPFQHLMLAQDTGGAIKSGVRGDVFWGFGAEAEAQAGLMQNTGRYFILFPKSAAHD